MKRTEATFDEEFGDNYSISVRHHKGSHLVALSNSGGRMITIATIVTKAGGIVTCGLAVCGPKDKPSPEIGRHVAMGRAIKNLQCMHPSQRVGVV